MEFLFVVMEFLIYTVVIFLFFLVISILIAFVLMHTRYFTALIKRRKGQERVRYFGFVKSRLTKKSILDVLVRAPLCITGVIIALMAMRAPYCTYTLRAGLRDTSTLRIRTGGFCHRRPDSEKELYKTSDNEEIRRFLNIISFRPTVIFSYCMCCGSMTFEFYDDDDELVRMCSFHHNTHLRFPDSSGDLYLTSRSKGLLVSWLSEKGVSQKLKEFMEERLAELYKPDEPNE